MAQSFRVQLAGGHAGSVGQYIVDPCSGLAIPDSDSGGEFGIRRASVRLAELAKNVGVTRFVFASSCLLADGVLDTNLRHTQPLRGDRAALAMAAKL